MLQNEPIAFILVGLILSVSAGVRATAPLLALSIVGALKLVTLPEDMQWLDSDVSLIALTAASISETLAYFIPVVGTFIKGIATPLAFAAGTLLMAAPAGLSS